MLLTVLIALLLPTLLQQAGLWESALKLFEEMEGKGLLPDLGTHLTRFTGTKAQILTQELRLVTYSTLIKAYERAGQWERALEVMKVIHRIVCIMYVCMFIYI